MPWHVESSHVQGWCCTGWSHLPGMFKLWARVDPTSPGCLNCGMHLFLNITFQTLWRPGHVIFVDFNFSQFRFFGLWRFWMFLDLGGSGTYFFIVISYYFWSCLVMLVYWFCNRQSVGLRIPSKKFCNLHQDSITLAGFCDHILWNSIQPRAHGFVNFRTEFRDLQTPLRDVEYSRRHDEPISYPTNCQN